MPDTASIFFQRGIADTKTLEMSSLTSEYCEGASFICSVFEVSNENEEFMTMSSDIKNEEYTPSMAFREREEEFEIIMVPFEELNITVEKEVGNSSSSVISEHDSVISSEVSVTSAKQMGILCTRSTDENYIKLWGQDHFDLHYAKYNIKTIWNWEKSSGLRPCRPYLRHCVLAAKRLGSVCYDSFLDETFLVDRKTTIRQYLQEFKEVMTTLPPPDLAERYGG